MDELIRTARLALAAALLAGIALVGWPSPAAAHAVLLSTTPADRSVLDVAPAAVSLEFNEPVSTTLGSVRAFAASGERIDEGDLAVEGASLRLGLRGGLGEGAYVVTYRVISQDAHPITGAFAFTVGAAAAADDATIAGLLGDEDDRTWEIAGAAARAVTYAGALLAAGLGVFLVLVHDGGHEAKRLRRWLSRAAGAGAGGLVASLVIHAKLATGLGVTALFQPSVSEQVLGDGVGASTTVVLAGLSFLALDEARSRARTLVFAFAATAGFAIAGHTYTADPRWLATVSDMVHVMAAAIWFGGLVGLVAILRARRDDAASAAGVVARFSGVAGMALVAVAMGGSMMGLVEVRTIDALTSTTYGKVLMAKVAIVATVAAMGGWNRFRLVPAITTAPVKAGTLLRRAVRLEAGLLVGAIALTGVLVNVTPARTAAGIGGIFSDTVAFGDGSVNVVVDPNRAGDNELHLYLFDHAGRVSDQTFDELTLRLSLPSALIGPLERAPYVAGPGHYQLDGGDLSIPGEWTVEVVARVDRFDRLTATITVPVNP